MKKKLLTILLSIAVILTSTVTVFADGMGNLEFVVTQSDHIGTDGKTIEYENGYKLSVTYNNIGDNRISNDVGHTELRDIPDGTSVTFTLTVPENETKVPDLMLSGARETFVNNTVTTNLNFSQNNVIRVGLDFGGNPGPDGPVAPTYSVDFGTASWTIDETTVTASVNGKVLTSGAVELTDDDEIVLTNFDPETMKANLVATDGFTTTLIVTDGVTHMYSLPDGAHLPGGTLTFSVSKMQDGPGPGQDDGHIVKLQINNLDGANGSVSLKFDTNQGFTTYTIADKDGSGNIKINIPEDATKVIFKAAPGGSFVLQDCTILHDNQDIDENKAYVSGVMGDGYEYTLPNDDKTIVFRADFGNELSTWNTVSWDGGNVEVKNGQVKAYAVHVGDKTYDENIETADETNKRYPLSDITKVDLQTYGVSFGGTDLFIAEGCTDDISIDFLFVPDYGYQVTDVRATEDSLLNQFAPGEEISTFHFTYKPETNVHFIVEFTKTNDIINRNSMIVTDAAIENGDNATNSGNLKMNIADVAPENVSNGLKNAVGETDAQYLDMTLSQVVSKTGDKGDWENQLTELNGSIDVSLTVSDLDPDGEYVIIREHTNGEGNTSYDEIPVTYNSETNTITFATDKFSTYALVKKSSSGSHTHSTGTEASTFEKEIKTFAELQDLLTTGGSGYLANDITATLGLTVEANVDLCLNGKKLNLDGKGNITVSIGKTLNLYDCGTNGTITGGNANGDTTEEKNGGGVYVSGTFNMYGGSITNNKATSYGAGVYVNELATFTMTGDSVVSDNEGKQGAGVYSKGAFTMSGNSQITRNTGTMGGGVGIGGGTFTMSGSSSITYNTGTGGTGVGGVYIQSGTFTMTGGSIGHNTGGYAGGVSANVDITLGGSANITGNVKGGTITGGLLTGGTANNVFLPNGKYIALDTDTKPTGSFKVGVTTYTAPTEGSPVKITTKGAATDTDFFTSDNSDYEVQYNTKGYLELVVKTTPSYTIADILPEDFPTSSSGGWLNGNGGKSYIMNGNLFVYGKNNVELSKTVTKKDDGNYEYQGTSGTKITFVMESGKLTKINVSGSVYPENNGTYVAPHVHTFTYAANDNVITATCIDGCTEGYDTDPLTLTLTAPTNLVYDGNAKAFTFADGEADAWTGAGLGLPTITYYQKYSGQSEYWKLNENPISVGNYKVKFIWGGHEVYVEFTINKATPYIKTNPAPSGIDLGQKLSDSTLFNGYAQVSSTVSTQVAGLFEWTNPDTVAALSDSETTLYDVTFTPTDTNNYTTAICQVKIRVNHTHNPIKINGQAPTETASGWKDYYQCTCGALFEDESGNTPIENLETWKAIGGNGYIAPLTHYEIIKGNEAKININENKDTVFTSNAEFSKFKRVEVDGITVDSSNYNVEEGSTIVTLKASYINSLSVGQHTIDIISTDGQASTTFTITKNNPSPSPGYDVPNTGVDGIYANNCLLFILSFISLLAIVVLVTIKRRTTNR